MWRKHKNLQQCSTNPAQVFQAQIRCGGKKNHRKRELLKIKRSQPGAEDMLKSVQSHPVPGSKQLEVSCFMGEGKSGKQSTMPH